MDEEKPRRSPPRPADVPDVAYYRPTGPAPQPGEPAYYLHLLAELMVAGVLTEDEVRTAKARIDAG